MGVTVADFMTDRVISVPPSAPFKEIVRRMVAAQVSGLPVVGSDGRVLGVVSEADLIVREEGTEERRGLGRRWRRGERSKMTGLLASDLMTSPAVTIRADARLGEAARAMRRRRVRRLPVVDGRGVLIGVLSRGDLLRAFLREDAEIEREIRQDVIRRTLWIDPDTIRVEVREGVVTLEGQLERRSLISVLLQLVADVPGVVGIVEHLSSLEEDGSPSGGFPVALSITPAHDR